MTFPIEFFVHGIPRPGGSKKGFVNPKTGRVVVVDMGGVNNKNWRESVKNGAREAYQGESILGPVRLDIEFVMPRPNRHYVANNPARGLRRDADRYHTSAPDRTKLARSTEDALTDAGIWRDDAQVVCGDVQKVYGGKPGAYIRISRPPSRDHEEEENQLYFNLFEREEALQPASERG